MESGKKEVSEFISTLNNLVEEDISAVRETSFTYGRYQQVEIDGRVADLMIDGLGRIIVPDELFFSGRNPHKVRLGSTREERVVLRAEPMSRGDKTVAWALYLAEKEY